jgi:arginase family enzyme
MLHLDLDGAWGDEPIAAVPRLDARAWGPRLRYCAPPSEIEAFNDFLKPHLQPFVLYGSGDFHHLAGLLIRAAAARSNGLHIVSFDNHPDWDIRPPKWGCGGWLSRAVELPNVAGADVWGCGNFELRFPSRLFANRSGRLKIHAWAERQPPSVQRRFDCMTADNWRDRFNEFAEGLKGRDIYITVDLDCLRREEAITNWENGLFTAADVAWAISELRRTANVIGGDLCGAASKPLYARFRQELAGKWDHPRISYANQEMAAAINRQSLNVIWRVLTGAIDL